MYLENFLRYFIVLPCCLLSQNGDTPYSFLDCLPLGSFSYSDLILSAAEIWLVVGGHVIKYPSETKGY